MSVYDDATRWREIADELALELEHHRREPGMRLCPGCRDALSAYEEARSA